MVLNKNPEIVAAVDLGSNSFHMIVARIKDGQLQVIDAIKEMVRLAAGVTPEHGIDAPTSERALECLQRFGQRLGNMHAEQVRVVGTNALRRASHGFEFLHAAEKALGYPIEIISGMEEARLIFNGVCHCVSTIELKTLVIDIGGGSTEIIIGQNATPSMMESLHIGCVGTSMSFFSNGKITAKRFEKAILAALQEFEPIAYSFKKAGWNQAIGSSGTARSIADNITDLKLGDGLLTLASLYALRDRLIESGHIHSIALPLVPPERAVVLPGGLAIMIAAFESLKIEHMQTTDCALREGILYELIGTHEKLDTHSHTVTSLCARYHVDMQHASRVESTALHIYAQVAETWQINQPDLKQMLSWAAMLHELGLSISHSRYQFHGAYLIEHSDLPGFNRQEQAEVATVIRLHRRKLHQEYLETHPFTRQSRLLHLIIVLRLAVVLHRSRSEQAAPELKIKINQQNISLIFPKGWLGLHPLTKADLKQEAEYLMTIGYHFEYR
ncbi:MAG: Ppx/GppA family phosphatase [Gammaproteobacteria bacterium]|nr:Ppx/GppA family phosphatase [Gammaproteobacteria bacterium]